nr:MAG TPA: hypothetical protein [Caudoviricetes sp.]
MFLILNFNMVCFVSLYCSFCIVIYYLIQFFLFVCQLFKQF